MATSDSSACWASYSISRSAYYLSISLFTLGLDDLDRQRPPTTGGAKKGGSGPPALLLLQLMEPSTYGHAPSAGAPVLLFSFIVFEAWSAGRLAWIASRQ